MTARATFFWLLMLLTGTVTAATLDGARLGGNDGVVRLVFELSEAVEHKIFGLESPRRLVIDLSDTRLQGSLPLAVGNPIISGIRSGARDGGALRVVLDLKQAASTRSYYLKPGGAHKQPRLVIDLSPTKTVASQPVVKKAAADLQSRDIVIAIDAGHGGHDPGARGKRGTFEKTVTLQISRRLASIINAEPGMKAVLIRDGDYYLGLRERMQRARKHRADLFISVHADAFRDSRVRGSSVYTLSRRGASSEAARWLAEKENASDLLGVKLRDKEDMLAEVLMDLSQSATTEASLDVATKVFGSLRGVGKTHKKSVQQAGFMVLKSPDIPSLLVETAFISNPTEEKRLRSASHQQKLAQAMFKGIWKYFSVNPPPGTRLATRTHKVRSGDTLSEIANRYDVSVSDLREFNGLNNNRIHTGKTLRIPGG